MDEKTGLAPRYAPALFAKAKPVVKLTQDQWLAERPAKRTSGHTTVAYPQGHLADGAAIGV